MNIVYIYIRFDITRTWNFWCKNTSSEWRVKNREKKKNVYNCRFEVLWCEWCASVYVCVFFIYFNICFFFSLIEYISRMSFNFYFIDFTFQMCLHFVNEERVIKKSKIRNKLCAFFPPSPPLPTSGTFAFLFVIVLPCSHKIW